MNNSRESALYYKVILAATDKRRDVQSIVLHVSRKDYRPARIICSSVEESRPTLS